MPQLRRRVAAFVALLFVLGTAVFAAAPSDAGKGLPPRPRLVVLISIDQFRADYLTRFADLFLPPQPAPGKVGGFRWLMERGAYHTDAHHDHYPLYTGPGHSILLTGAPPYKSGIVGNEWFDRGLGRSRYCVEDPESPLVGVGKPEGKAGISPATLRVSTVGDELKIATGRKARVWGLALKDRAAVLMAGRLADGVLWFDDETGNWISSRFYYPEGALPAWVTAWNGKERAAAIDGLFGKEWKPSFPASAIARLFTPGSRYANDPSALGTGFPHEITGGLKKPGKDFYRAWATTPYANGYVLDTARRLIAAEKLGQDPIPDLLAINLSSNDYVGHAYGPDSPEALDITVQTDRQLADFFNALGRAVPGGLSRVVVILTADHGVVGLPGALKEAGFPAGSYDEEGLQKAVAAALGDGGGDRKEGVPVLVEDNLYLSDKLAPEARQKAEETAARVAAAQPGVYAAYTRSQILAGQLPATDIGARIARSFHPKVSGDVVLVLDPYWVPGKLVGTTHGTPYAYDTSVPLLLAGPGIRKGRYTERVSTLDIAPTLAYLLGILQPSGCEGRVLSKAVE
jgi:predicted AlkP superfamily pyrophosphatase or phosphodiesterase